jgi:hypothetical protein
VKGRNYDAKWWVTTGQRVSNERENPTIGQFLCNKSTETETHEIRNFSALLAAARVHWSRNRQ